MNFKEIPKENEDIEKSAFVYNELRVQSAPKPYDDAKHRRSVVRQAVSNSKGK